MTKERKEEVIAVLTEDFAAWLDLNEECLASFIQPESGLNDLFTGYAR